jgi:hypothetical protein
VAACLNLINELFGGEQAVAAVAHADSGVTVKGEGFDFGVPPDVVRWRATYFFLWMAAFIGVVSLIGFIPAIAVFVFAYMCFGFGEPPLPCVIYSAATTALCWVVFHWALGVAWPHSFLGDWLPDLRAYTGLI